MARLVGPAPLEMAARALHWRLGAGARSVAAAPGARRAAGVRTDPRLLPRQAARHDRRQRVRAARTFDVTVDGIYFGQSTTDAHGAFSSSLILRRPRRPVSRRPSTTSTRRDGTSSARRRVHRDPRGRRRFLSTRGNPHTLRAPFEVWGFSLAGSARGDLPALRGASRAGRPTGLGTAAGQCGYLRTSARTGVPVLAVRRHLDVPDRHERAVLARIRGARSAGSGCGSAEPAGESPTTRCGP